MTLVSAMKRTTGWVFFGLVCIALVTWNFAPVSSHAPKFTDLQQIEIEIVDAHGHSHDTGKDLLWIAHGHTHDVADHDHTQAVFAQMRMSHLIVETTTAWRGDSTHNWAAPSYRLDRPPTV